MQKEKRERETRLGQCMHETVYRENGPNTAPLNKLFLKTYTFLGSQALGSTSCTAILCKNIPRTVT